MNNKLLIISLLGLSFWATANANAVIIQETWTTEITDIADQDSHFTANIGDSFSFTLTYNDAIHSMMQVDDGLDYKLCDRIGDSIYSDCDDTYLEHYLHADNITNSLFSKLSSLVGGQALYSSTDGYDWRYSYDGNDVDVSNDFGYVSFYNGVISAAFNDFDANSTDADYGNAYLYDTNQTYLGSVQFGEMSVIASAFVGASEPHTLVLFLSGIVGLVSLRRRTRN